MSGITTPMPRRNQRAPYATWDTSRFSSRLPFGQPQYWLLLAAALFSLTL